MPRGGTAVGEQREAKSRQQLHPAGSGGAKLCPPRAKGGPRGNSGTRKPSLLGAPVGSMVMRRASAFRGHWASASSSGCGGRAPQGGPWSVSRRFRGFLGGSHACAPQPAGRRGPAQALPVCALEPTSSLGLCSLQAHHFPGVGRTGESEQRPARAPEPGGHLSSI